MEEITIAIIGGGKAAGYHLSGYFSLMKKMGKIVRLILVEPRNFQESDFGKKLVSISEGKISVVHFMDWDCFFSLNPPRDNLWIDVCLPSRLTPSFVERCISGGYSNLLIEKPFLFQLMSHGSLLKLHKLILDNRLFIVENYLHSPLYIRAKQIIAEKKLKLVSLTSDFSKDRRLDSLNNRAFSEGAAPTVWEIEFPHMVYLAIDLFNSSGNLYFCSESDMKVGSRIIKRHGSGIAFFSFGPFSCLLATNLQNVKLVRIMDLKFSDGSELHLNFRLDGGNGLLTYSSSDGSQYKEIVECVHVDMEKFLQKIVFEIQSKEDSFLRLNRYMVTNSIVWQLMSNVFEKEESASGKLEFVPAT